MIPRRKILQSRQIHASELPPACTRRYRSRCQPISESDRLNHAPRLHESDANNTSRPPFGFDTLPHRNSALDCLFPCSLGNRRIVRVDQLQPAQTLQLTRRQSGIVQHMLIEALDGAVRTRHPNHLRDGLIEELESTGKVSLVSIDSLPSKQVLKRVQCSAAKLFPPPPIQCQCDLCDRSRVNRPRNNRPHPIKPQSHLARGNPKR